MSTPSEKLRDRWLEALLPKVADVGWSTVIAKQAARELGLSAGEQALAAPNGVADLIDHFFDRATDKMFQTLSKQDLDALRTHERVAAGLRAWLTALVPPVLCQSGPDAEPNWRETTTTLAFRDITSTNQQWWRIRYVAE